MYADHDCNRYGDADRYGDLNADRYDDAFDVYPDSNRDEHGARFDLNRSGLHRHARADGGSGDGDAAIEGDGVQAAVAAGQEIAVVSAPVDGGEVPGHQKASAGSSIIVAEPVFSLANSAGPSGSRRSRK